MSFIADALQQAQGRAVTVEGERFHAVTGEDELFLLGQADGHQVRQPNRLKRRVRGIQLPFTAIDHDQIRERPPVLEHARVAAPHHLLHRREVIEEPAFGRRRARSLRRGA